MNLQRIVIGIDFSPASADTARWAAQHFGRASELILVHAVASLPADQPDSTAGTLRENARMRLSELADSIADSNMRVEVREGDAATALPSVALEYEAELIVVGAHGERAGHTQAIGTTAQHVVGQSTVPVMVVAQTRDSSISNILVPVDDDGTGRTSLRWAALLAERFDARVTTLHVRTSGAMSHTLAAGDSARDTAQSHSESTKRWIELARESGVPHDRVTSEERFGIPAAEIVSASEQSGADMIVIGRRAAGGLKRALLGSVTATVLRNPPANMLVVPAE
jgi:nucleotide-binding universal stress UspA family protein